MCSITTIAAIDAIGATIRHAIGMATGIIALIIGHTIAIGDRHRSIAIHRAIAQPRCIVVAMRMCAGVTTAIALTAPMTIRFSPIMDHGVSAIRLIFRAYPEKCETVFGQRCALKQIFRAPI